MSRDCCRDGSCWECHYFRDGGWQRDFEAREAYRNSWRNPENLIMAVPFVVMYAIVIGTAAAGVWAIAAHFLTGRPL